MTPHPTPTARCTAARTAGYAPGRDCSRGRGFTLIEFLITLAVLVITLGVAVPALSTFVSQNQAASIKSVFVSSVALARSEAARSGVQVLLQAGSGGVTGNEYAKGWDVYLDNDASGTVTSGDTLLRHYEALPPAVKLAGNATLVFNAKGYITPSSNVAYSLCRADGSGTGYRVSLAPNGTAYTQSGAGCI